MPPPIHSELECYEFEKLELEPILALTLIGGRPG